VRQAVAGSGGTVGIHPVLMCNSDHANFTAKRISTLRLVTGFDEPQSNLRHMLRDRPGTTESG
jgi:hypothetical protein